MDGCYYEQFILLVVSMNRVTEQKAEEYIMKEKGLVVYPTISPIWCIQPTERWYKVHSTVVFHSGCEGLSIFG